MGIGRQKGIGVISLGLWTWGPFWTSVVFLDANEFGSGHGVALPSIQIVKDDGKDGFIYDYFLDDARRRGCGWTRGEHEETQTDGREILTGVEPPTAGQGRIGQEQGS